MSVIMYFLPGRRELVGLKQVGELGLDYAFDGPSITSREVINGPEGAAGIIFACGDGDVRYKLEKQTWEPYPGKLDDAGKPALWYGYWTDDPPGPDYFARKGQFDGHLVKLGDGQQWLVPVARRIDGTTVLPRSMSWRGDDERWGPGEVIPVYRELFSQACRLFDTLLAAASKAEEGDMSVEMTFNEEADICAIALAANYRLGPAEISLLNLFDTQTEPEVAFALVDWPALKKKLAESASSDNSARA